MITTVRPRFLTDMSSSAPLFHPSGFLRFLTEKDPGGPGTPSPELLTAPLPVATVASPASQVVPSGFSLRAGIVTIVPCARETDTVSAIERGLEDYFCFTRARDFGDNDGN
jgi:hypothetical protein